MASTRLPGKALRPLCGKPMLQYVLERVSRSARVRALAVCTSDQPQDDPIAQWCERLGVRCARGPHEHVAQRLLTAAERLGLTAFVRICGDSPLVDPALIDACAALYVPGRHDLVTNKLRRSFPLGETVELVDLAALRRAVGRMSTAAQREHVTTYFYEHPDEFEIVGISNGVDLSSLKLCVDTEEDFERVEAIVSQMRRDHWDYSMREIVERFCTMPV